MKSQAVINETENSYYKVITKCDRSLLQSASGIAKCNRLLLQSASGVTKCDRLLLQSASGITKCDSYYKVRRNSSIARGSVLAAWMRAYTSIPYLIKTNIMDFVCHEFLI